MLRVYRWVLRTPFARPSPASGRHRFSPRLSPLEERVVPSDIRVQIVYLDYISEGTWGGWHVVRYFPALNDPRINQSLTVKINAPTGTAVNGIDYTGVVSQVTIRPGAHVALVELEAMQDLLVEPTETVVVTIAQTRRIRSSRTDKTIRN